MDSRLIAGAYSQHFRALEKEVTLNDSSRTDSLVRAKRLSQETNKRRKVQAHKRKLEAKREERRRQDILSRRREEQREATEKYQRSHLPLSARQGSGRISPRRTGGRALDDALRLIRGTPQYERPRSVRERILSPSNENGDPLERPYFDITGHHTTRPGSARSAHQLDPSARAELMDSSLQNLTNSKTLFEQQLEHQQHLLLEQQQKSLKEFDNAVRQELERPVAAGETTGDFYDDGNVRDNEGMNDSDSCSSLDSLEDSAGNEKELERPRNPGYAIAQQRLRPVSAHHAAGSGQMISQNNQQGLMVQQDQLRHQEQQQQQQQQLAAQQQKQQHFYLNSSANNKNSYSSNRPLNQDMTASAVFQRDPSLCGMERTEMSQKNSVPSQHNHPYVGLTREDILKNQDRVANGDHKASPASKPGGEQKFQLPFKQFSTDSLESCSSTSSISVVKLPASTGNVAGTGHPSPSQMIGNGGKDSSHNGQLVGVAGYTAGILHQQGPEGKSHGQDFGAAKTVSTTEMALSSQSQLAWVSPAPQSDTSAPTQTPTPTNKNEPVIEDFHPRYASAIGLSIWPGHNTQNHIPTSMMSTILANNHHPYSSRGTLTSVTSTTSYPASMPARSVPNTNSYSMAGAKSDAVLKSGIVGSSISSAHTVNNDFSSLSKQDLSYPYVHDSQHLGTVNPNVTQKQVPVSSAAQVQQQIVTPSMQTATAPTKQINVQIPGAQSSVAASHVSSFPQQLAQEDAFNSFTQQNQQQMYQTHQAPSGPVPVPAVRTVFPTSRPPAPATTTATKITQAGISAQNKIAGMPTGHISGAGTNKDHTGDFAKEDVEEDGTVEEDSEEMRPLKGILKQTPIKGTPQAQGKANHGKGHPRDSLELARLNQEKKGKKKSVRFADHDIEEDDNEVDETDQLDTRAMMITNSGTPFNKNAVNRPVSAKVVSMSAKPETAVRAPRAASAGTVRQTPAVSEHMQIRNVQQLHNNSATSNITENNNVANNQGFSHRSNLPPAFVNPLGTTPVHRPKAAAHIIMSTDLQQLSKGIQNGYDSHGQMNHSGSLAATAHKSNFDAKVKSVNKNFMSKVPVKVPAGVNTNAVVYHVAQVGNEGSTNGTTNTNGYEMTVEEENLQTMKEAQQSMRMNYSPTKKVPISNATVTRTSIVPASTKITYPQSNSGAPSYSNSAGNTSVTAVYGENGMRIDRTPTDEEITWLWDKVRNCLNKEEGGSKSQQGGGGNGDQGSRQPPAMSTKLIDGDALGFGANNGGMNGLRTGTGFAYPRAASATTTQNRVKPALQQQGSYLRRYGLLKQRRVNSASAVGNGTASQRVNSALYGRQPAVQPSHPATMTGLQQQQEAPPTSLAFSYKPQDEVTESTAAFLMAERLAKQSLSDSHIQAAMDDAKNKQEAHNRARLAIARGHGAGPSALSMEEQRLLESLDKLNDRLKVTDPKHNGTIHYHQPYQPHLPGFRGHTPVIDSRRHNLLMSPRTQPRSQSARIRQQIRQYR